VTGGDGGSSLGGWSSVPGLEVISFGFFKAREALDAKNLTFSMEWRKIWWILGQFWVISKTRTGSYLNPFGASL
jgi:hypothetical protein